MAAQPPQINDEDMGFGERVLRKAERNPFLAFGIVGFLTTLGIGAYRFKSRSKAYPMSLFFINLRVAAQSVVVGSLTIGMGYNMYNYWFLKSKEDRAKTFKH